MIEIFLWSLLAFAVGFIFGVFTTALAVMGNDKEPKSNGKV